MNNIIDTNGLNANDGIVGPHREKEGSFFALKEIFSPIKIDMKELPAEFNGNILLENRFHFTNTSVCEFKWALVNFRNPDEPLAGYSVEKKGSAIAPSIAPHAKGNIRLKLPADYQRYDALIMAVANDHHEEIYRWTWRIKTNDQLLSNILVNSDSLVTSNETDSTYSLHASGIMLVLNKKDGMLQQTKNISRGYNLSFNHGPVFTQGTSEVTNAAASKEGKERVVTFNYSGALKYAKWKMFGNGWVALEYEYQLNGRYPFAGISFNYPENFILGTKWLGKGPYRQWKNRTQGTPLNVWQNLYNNTQTGYSPFVYPEFKGYYGDITWMEFNTTEGKFYAASKDKGLNIRLFDFYGLTGDKPFPALPVGNISFLDYIPPIGTKLAMNISSNTALLGPQSELSIINSPVKRTVFFYFGSPKTVNSKEAYSRPSVDDVF